MGAKCPEITETRLDLGADRGLAIVGRAATENLSSELVRRAATRPQPPAAPAASAVAVAVPAASRPRFWCTRHAVSDLIERGNAYGMCRHMLADVTDVFIAARLRVSATASRVAAAYGDDNML